MAAGDAWWITLADQATRLLGCYCNTGKFSIILCICDLLAYGYFFSSTKLLCDNYCRIMLISKIEHQITAHLKKFKFKFLANHASKTNQILTIESYRLTVTTYVHCGTWKLANDQRNVPKTAKTAKTLKKKKKGGRISWCFLWVCI